MADQQQHQLHQLQQQHQQQQEQHWQLWWQQQERQQQQEQQQQEQQQQEEEQQHQQQEQQRQQQQQEEQQQHQQQEEEQQQEQQQLQQQEEQQQHQQQEEQQQHQQQEEQHQHQQQEEEQQHQQQEQQQQQQQQEEQQQHQQQEEEQQHQQQEQQQQQQEEQQQHQQQEEEQQPPPQPSTQLGNTQAAQIGRVVWKGQLEWYESRCPNLCHECVGFGHIFEDRIPSSTNFIRIYNCLVIMANDSPLKVENWPPKFIMQLIPRVLLNSLSGLIQSSQKVHFQFPSQGNDPKAMTALKKVMRDDFVGYIRFPTGVPCNIRVLMLMYSSRNDAFIGFIPNNQTGFVNQFCLVVTRQKRSQAERARGQMPTGPFPTPAGQQTAQPQVGLPTMPGTMAGQSASISTMSGMTNAGGNVTSGNVMQGNAAATVAQQQQQRQLMEMAMKWSAQKLLQQQLQRQQQRSKMSEILLELGLLEAARSFVENDVGFPEAAHLSKRHFEQLGVSKIGDQIRIKQRCREEKEKNTRVPSVVQKLKDVTKNRRLNVKEAPNTVKVPRLIQQEDDDSDSESDTSTCSKADDVSDFNTGPPVRTEEKDDGVLEMYDEYINSLGDSEEELAEECAGSHDTPTSGQDKMGLREIQRKMMEFKNDDLRRTIVVQRNKILQSTVSAVSAPGFDFWQPFTLTFAGEEDENGFGPKRDFFKLLMQEVRTTMGVFRSPSAKGMVSFTHDLKLLRSETYKLAGKFLTWSFVNGGPGLNAMCKSSYNVLAGKDICQEDMEHITDETARANLFKLKGCNSQEQFDDAIQDMKDWLLEQGVTKIVGLQFAERDMLIKDLMTHKFSYKVQASIKQFCEGLGPLYDEVKRNPVATAPLFVYGNKILRKSDLKQMYIIDYSPEGSNNRAEEEDTVYSFEAFLLECEANTTGVSLNEVLEFWTAAPDIPPCGFKTQPRIGFYSTTPGTRRLPSAHTCITFLWLPRGVGDPDELRGMMVQSIQNCYGFGKI